MAERAQELRLVHLSQHEDVRQVCSFAGLADSPADGIGTPYTILELVVGTGCEYRFQVPMGGRLFFG